MMPAALSSQCDRLTAIGRRRSDIAKKKSAKKKSAAGAGRIRRAALARWIKNFGPKSESERGRGSVCYYSTRLERANGLTPVKCVCYSGAPDLSAIGLSDGKLCDPYLRIRTATDNRRIA